MTVTETVKAAVGLSTDPKAAPATREAMSEARLPLAYRDSCANLLIPLNRCRYEEYYLPWKCEVSAVIAVWIWMWREGMGIGIEQRLMNGQTERHSYEKCQYDEFKKRVAKMDELRVAKGGERSN
ncbi:NADH dehydrogenase [ubiquinone] 1 beta subcomplex subunit [Lachnellula occidentalis]|uniref:NADH dehydrogenase [ubiquinone] 1 beta subcomplex subunit 7 n=1 Tax=Lachnellula occidentalis TaxID=215460 RepID=A0A8H8UJX4_9HELO|nr:NADH dehydrogenase [ubiquinone] 1 beta subcomplex subunit [Lachnellula occidentalis]